MHPIRSAGKLRDEAGHCVEALNVDQFVQQDHAAAFGYTVDVPMEREMPVAPDLEFLILGPFDVCAEGSPLRLPSAKQRALSPMR